MHNAPGTMDLPAADRKVPCTEETKYCQCVRSSLLLCCIAPFADPRPREKEALLRQIVALPAKGGCICATQKLNDSENRI